MRRVTKKVESHQHLSTKTFNVAVVGLSGSEKEKGCKGVGKSCLCNRFVRPFAGDYHKEHISVLSQTDFSGQVVNNDHWLYWGEVTKLVNEGTEVTFSVIEQTEFIDDSCFQPFKTGKTEPYYKRCAATRLCSTDKLMYICKNQLGIEKEYEQKYLNDGRFLVDAFVCVFDVSEVQGRSLDKAIEYTGLILNNLIKTKKPVVLVTTKHDEANEFYLREAEKLVNRKEFRGIVPIIETSAHNNINVDNAFITCFQLLDRNNDQLVTEKTQGTQPLEVTQRIKGILEVMKSPTRLEEWKCSMVEVDRLFLLMESMVKSEKTTKKENNSIKQNRNSRRANLIHTLQMESKQLRELKYENEQLSKALEEYQVTVQFLMNKYRELTGRFSETKLILPDQLTLDDHEAALARQFEKINEMSAVMAKAVQLDENASEKEDQNLIEKLRKENDRLRRLLSS
ncbi:rho GTPase-activating protein 190 [Tetranychus urticae]|uniref:Uncharacterized protein n=1 Tax=Tetranychus urticae TaxID=32264 RepID=T1KJS6_TETUR|nr:rho GTPase-activating protein 190 [Tetranychus urticae]